MAYKLDYTDPTKGSITVLDGTINNTDTMLTFVGKNYYGYGELINEDLLRLLENFAGHYGVAGENLPTNGIEGQMIYNADAGGIYVYGANGGGGVGSAPGWSPLSVGGVAAGSVTEAGTGNVYNVGMVNDVDPSGTGQTIVIFSARDIDVDPSDPIYDTLNNGDGFRYIRKGVTIRGFDPATGLSLGDFKYHGTAATAQYGADLAEMYYSDEPYEPGTVVELGGVAEITATTSASSVDVFGVVSTDPAYVMNAGAVGTVCAVALAGRVPCKVLGRVNKGDRLVSAGATGYARAALPEEAMDWRVVIGRALDNKESDGEGIVEVAVGAK